MAEFSLGMFNKLQVKNGYLVIGKEGKTVRMSDIKSINITKGGLVLNGEKNQLATIKGLSEKKAFAAIDFINTERDKIKAVGKPEKTAKSPLKQSYRKFLLMLVLVIVLAMIIIALLFLINQPVAT